MALNQYSPKTLQGNWVEMQSCAHLDSGEDMKNLQILGHKGIVGDKHFKTNYESSADRNYPNPAPPIDTTAIRTKAMEQKMYEHAKKVVTEASKKLDVKIDYTSTMKDSFTKEYNSTKPAPTKQHDVYRDNAISYWESNIDAIHGISNVLTTDTPFKKNSAFSTPIQEYKDEPLPHNTHYR